MATGIVNNDFSDVVFNRYAERSLDPNVKISYEELLEIIAQATRAPSALDSQPWHFLIAHTDEGKAKLDSWMWSVDRGRIISSSASVVVFADLDWFEHFEEIVEQNRLAPNGYSDEAAAMTLKLAAGWMPELIAEGGLESSVIFQAGLVAMQLMLVARAHGYETGPMDAFTREGFAADFGLDEARFIPLFFIAIGKPAATLAAPVEEAAAVAGHGGVDFGDTRSLSPMYLHIHTTRRAPEQVSTFV